MFAAFAGDAAAFAGDAAAVAAVIALTAATESPSTLARGSGSSDEPELSDVSDALGLSELLDVSESSGMREILLKIP
ncbi:MULTISPECIES: hypothetical protein [Corynebacterium]|uniref:hypothetical protein n=1 Tax=Corynebacterium TaxID=1716 RepID=UPI000AC76950|nr:MULTISPECIES: hypothetical protein [Corynebacterium]KAA9226447.1 hypothetical protein F6I42_05540 [Corynebacterium amycolatum]MCG7269976.1 hypothetical protein [Corynebacterium amycolatum]